MSAAKAEIEPTVLRELVGTLGADSVHSVIKTFLDDAPLQLADFLKGAKEGDIALVRRVAHTLKSIVASLGAVSFSQLCEEVETSARIGTLQDVTRAVPEVEARLKRVCEELKATLPGG